MSVWDAALPKIDALIAEHKEGRHKAVSEAACPSCLFRRATWPDRK